MNKPKLDALNQHIRSFSSRYAAHYIYYDEQGTPIDVLFRQKYGNNQKSYVWYHYVENLLRHGRSSKPDAGHFLFELPRLLQYEEAIVIVCEGEKACAALNERFSKNNERNLAVATTSGGATSATHADWSPLSQRKIFIWPDNDEPGKKYGQAVFTILQTTAQSLEIVSPDLLGLSDKEDAVEWLQSNPTATTEEILAALAAAVEPPEPTPVSSAMAGQGRSTISKACAPLPLMRELEVPPEFPIDALGELKGVVSAIAEATQAPIEIAANSVLAVVSLAVQGKVIIRTDHGSIPPSLFFLTIAESGERKSSVDSAALKPVREHQLQQFAKYRLDFASYQHALETLEKGAPKPAPPVNPMMINQDFTLDALIKGLIYGNFSQGVFLSEAATFLNGYATQKEMLMRTAALLSDLWSGGVISRQRVTESDYAADRRLAINMLGQQEVVSPFLSNPMLKQQGLLNRFLIAAPTSTIGFRPYKRTNLKADTNYQIYCQRVSELLGSQCPIDPATGTPDFAKLSIAEDAYAEWINIYNQIEEHSAKGGDLYPYRGYVAKLAEQILRLAAVLTVFADPRATQIQLTEMKNAIELGDFYLDEYIRLTDLETPSDLVNAQKLLEWLRIQPSPISLRDIYRYGPSFVRNVQTARNLIGILLEHFWVSEYPDQLRGRDGKLSAENYSIRSDGY